MVIRYVTAAILLSGLSYGLSRMRIGKLESYPYQDTVYVESSKLNTMLKCDGRTGICAGLYYLALYQNIKRDNIDTMAVQNGSDKSTVYYLTSTGTVENFNKEFYFNKPGSH